MLTYCKNVCLIIIYCEGQHEKGPRGKYAKVLRSSICRAQTASGMEFRNAHRARHDKPRHECKNDIGCGRLNITTTRTLVFCAYKAGKSYHCNVPWDKFPCTEKCRFLDKRVREISRFFVAPPSVFPLSVWRVSWTLLSRNTSTSVDNLDVTRREGILLQHTLY